MPLFIGNVEYDVYMGNKQVDVYQGTTPITGEDVNPLDCSGVAGQPTGETVCSGTSLFGYRYTGQPSADGLSCATETYMIESNSASCGFVNPTDTYSNWTNVGSPYLDTTETVGSFGAWMLIQTSSLQEFQNEQRCRTITTTIATLQDQVRTCTASGGCSGALSRTVSSGMLTNNQQDCETRVTTTPNPLYVPPFTSNQISVNASINRDTGEIHSIGVIQPSNPCPQTFEYGEWTVGLAAGQPSSFVVLQTGAASVQRSVKLNVQGLVPQGFQEECEEFDFDITISVTQQSPALAQPTISASVSYTDTNGTSQTIAVTDGGDYGIELDDNTEYRVEATATGGATFDSTKFGIGSYDATGPSGRKHNLSATNTVGTATLAFDVTATAGGAF